MDNRKKIILVVDDEVSVLGVIRIFLESEDFTVLTVGKGNEAIQVASGVNIDLLLADVFLPSITAKVLANRISALQPLLKVIFMSGYSRQTITDHGVLPAGAEILQKPIAKKDLIKQVHASLASGTYWRQISGSSRIDAGPQPESEFISVKEIGISNQPRPVGFFSAIRNS